MIPILARTSIGECVGEGYFCIKVFKGCDRKAPIGINKALGVRSGYKEHFFWPWVLRFVPV